MEPRSTIQKKWFEDRTFLSFWLTHVIVISLVWWFELGSIFQITFENGNVSFYWWTKAVLGLALILPVWGLQVLVLQWCRFRSSATRYVVVLASYLYGLGIFIPLAILAEKKLPPRLAAMPIRIIKGVASYFLIQCILIFLLFVWFDVITRLLLKFS